MRWLLPERIREWKAAGVALNSEIADVRPAGGRGASKSSQGGVVSRVLRHMLARPVVLLSLLFTLALVIIAIYVWVADPLAPNEQDLRNRMAGPSWDHLLGLDNLGRDIFARMLHATRVGVLSILQGVGVAAALGVLPGAIAGFQAGKLDAVLSRVADALIAFPGLILAMGIIAVLGPSLTNAMVAIGVINAPRVYRVVRAASANMRGHAFIDAATMFGSRPIAVMLRHVLPNVAGVTAVQLALISARVLLAESSLSYLGLGVQPPNATWGSMIRDAQPFMATQPWLIVIPGMAIMLTALALNYVADGLAAAMGASVGYEGGEGEQ